MGRTKKSKRGVSSGSCRVDLPPPYDSQFALAPLIGFYHDPESLSPGGSGGLLWWSLGLCVLLDRGAKLVSW